MLNSNKSRVVDNSLVCCDGSGFKLSPACSLSLSLVFHITFRTSDLKVAFTESYNLPALLAKMVDNGTRSNKCHN